VYARFRYSDMKEAARDCGDAARARPSFNWSMDVLTFEALTDGRKLAPVINAHDEEYGIPHLTFFVQRLAKPSRCAY